ncbi:PBPRA1643 family SWIM/SEC-C metal-binding motif protein [Pseudoalteromonas denitrificans]|nr:PBPRA1643 family SWIM/SEC-C metal-binding motif protein [Pseudoalteromonas denitrificans]
MSKFFFMGRPDVMGKYDQKGFSPKRNEKMGSKLHPLSLVVNSEARKLEIEEIISNHKLFASIELNLEGEEDINELEFALNKPKTQVVDKMPERNAPCLCGSGKKYKKCCG